MNGRILGIAKSYLPFWVRINIRKIGWWISYKRIERRQSCPNYKKNPKVYCPISRTYFTNFINSGKYKVAPVWGTRNHHRLIWLYLENETNLLKKENILLHIVPEYGIWKRLKSTAIIEYHPVELILNGKGEYMKGSPVVDLTRLDYAGNTFDFIICNYILDHIQDDARAIKEMFRVLKPNGMALITVPNYQPDKDTIEDESITKPKERKKYFGEWNHYRKYGKDLTARLQNAGFEVTEEDYGRKFTKEEFETYGLFNDILFICRKNEQALKTFE
jgi:SAM-dependent methyltransferase